MLFVSCRTFPKEISHYHEVDEIPEFQSSTDIVEQYEAQLELYLIIYADRTRMLATGFFNEEELLKSIQYIENIINYLEEQLEILVENDPLEQRGEHAK